MKIRTDQMQPASLWDRFKSTLSYPQICLDIGFVALVLLDIGDLPNITFSQRSYTFAQHLGILIGASSFYIFLGFFIGLQLSAWQRHLGMGVMRYIRNMPSFFGATFAAISLVYVPIQITGALVLLPSVFNLLPITSLITGILSMFIGGFLAEEINEHESVIKSYYNIKLQNFTDFLPGYAFVFMAIFPIEFIYTHYSREPEKVTLWGAGLIVVSFLCYRLFAAIAERLSRQIEKKSTSATWQAIIKNGVYLCAILGLFLMEGILYADLKARGYSSTSVKVFFCFFGLIPFRLFSLLVPPMNPLNILFALLSMAVYLHDL